MHGASAQQSFSPSLRVSSDQGRSAHSVRTRCALCRDLGTVAPLDSLAHLKRIRRTSTSAAAAGSGMPLAQASPLPCFRACCLPDCLHSSLLLLSSLHAPSVSQGLAGKTACSANSTYLVDVKFKLSPLAPIDQRNMCMHSDESLTNLWRRVCPPSFCYAVSCADPPSACPRSQRRGAAGHHPVSSAAAGGAHSLCRAPE